MINRKVAAAARLLNLILAKERNYDLRGTKHDNKSKKIMDTLSDAEKRNLFRIIKSGVLLTSGRVEVVRNPNLFNDENATPWETILAPHIKRFFVKYGEDPTADITQLDYLLAKRLLPIIGQISFSEEEAEKTAKAFGIKHLSGAVRSQHGEETNPEDNTDTLYRGLNSMGLRHFIACTDIGRKWDISRGVSTSRRLGAARGFALDRVGYRILFTINNSVGGGFFMSGLSYFTSEEEIVLSGQLEVIDWNLVTTHRAVIPLRLTNNPDYDRCNITQLSITKDSFSAALNLWNYQGGDELVTKKIQQSFNGSEDLIKLLNGQFELDPESGVSGTLSKLSKHNGLFVMKVNADWSPKEEPEEVNENYLRHARRSKMKLTKSQLKQIIKEELEQVTKEAESEDNLMEVDAESAIAELTAAMQVPMTSGGNKRKKRK